MPSELLKKLLLVSFLLLPLATLAQEKFYMLRGYVYTADNEPLAGASVRVFNLSIGTQTDEKGRYEIRLPDGFHRLTFSYVAHVPQSVELVMSQDRVQNIWLKQDEKVLNEVEVKLRKRDASYEIIQRVIEQRDALRKPYATMRCETYIKALETSDSKKTAKAAVSVDKAETDSSPLDKKPTDTLSNTTLFECQLMRYEAPPTDIKEERLAVKSYGKSTSLFFKSITDGEFSLYENTQKVAKLSEHTFVSPISKLGLISYKFKLLRSYYDGQQKIYQISVAPRELGNALFSGEIEVVDGVWALRKVRLSMPKKTLNLYDEFNFEQHYELVQNRWMITAATYQWKLKQGGSTRHGSTVVKQQNFVFDMPFPKRFFGVEKAVTTQEAYERDTTYWASIRPEPLSVKEQAIVAYKDSVERWLNSKQYLDSIDRVYNKITPLKVLWFGVGHINRAEKKDWYFAPLVSVVNPVSVGGVRVQYQVSFTKRFDNRKMISLSPNLSYGFLNRDIRGGFRVNYLYNPKRVSSVGLSLGDNIGFINGSATIADFLKRDNFYQQRYIDGHHRTELFNGFYLHSGMGYMRRADLGDFKFAEKSIIPNNNEPKRFPSSYSLHTNLGFSFTPQQNYISEPNQKIVLGSKYPTFTLDWRKAWSMNRSDWANHSSLNLSLHQLFTVGVLGTSEYRVSMSKFLDTTRLAVMDYRYIRGGDRFLFTPAMTTFQLLPKTFPVFNWHYQAHYVHQFNGFLTSKIPLINKLGIYEMAGAGFLYVPERRLQYSEIYLGLNKIVKLGNNRFRIGVYNVLGQSNQFGVKNQFKVSFEVFNRDRNTWSF